MIQPTSSRRRLLRTLVVLASASALVLGGTATGAEPAGATVSSPASPDPAAETPAVAPEATSVLSGTVTAAGIPAAGASVLVFSADTHSYAGSATADASGAYSVDLPAGNYKVLVQPNRSGYPNQWQGGTGFDAAQVLAVNGAATADLVLSAGPNLLANGSVEESAGDVPAGWETNTWGANTPSFEYVSGDAHDGTRSVKASITGYTDGDAKWAPVPFPLEQGAQFRYSAWYKTDARVLAVVRFIWADGTQEDTYFGMQQPLPGPDAANEWQSYTGTFLVPHGVTAVSPFLFLGSDGFLQMDDVRIERYSPDGFDRPLVTLTFDDGQQVNASTALPAMKEAGFVSTQCFATTFVLDDPAVQEQIKDFRDAGHEICSHSVTHPPMSTLTPEQLTTEARDSQKYLRELTGEPVDNFATPFGDYNLAVIQELQKYYRSHRTVEEGFNSKDSFDLWRVRVQNMKPTTTIEEFQSWLDIAKATNTWLVLVYHVVAPDGMQAGPYDTPLADFVPQLDALKASGLEVKTYDAALDELQAQLP